MFIFTLEIILTKYLKYYREILPRSMYWQSYITSYYVLTVLYVHLSTRQGITGSLLHNYLSTCIFCNVFIPIITKIIKPPVDMSHAQKCEYDMIISRLIRNVQTTLAIFIMTSNKYTRVNPL